MRFAIDAGNIEKQLAQVLSVGAFGVLSAPTQALALYVDETSLNKNSWPCVSQRLSKMWISVYGRRKRAKAAIS